MKVIIINNTFVLVALQMIGAPYHQEDNRPNVHDLDQQQNTDTKTGMLCIVQCHSIGRHYIEN